MPDTDLGFAMAVAERLRLEENALNELESSKIKESVALGKSRINGFVECLHTGQHVGCSFDVQEVTVDAIRRKVLRKA